MSPTEWESSAEGRSGWLFVEFPEFTRVWQSYFRTDDEYARYQIHLAGHPTSGDVMPGCGGVRKDRWPDPRRGKGKRGGLRIIYLQVPEVRVITLIDVYDKNEAEDLTPEEKREVGKLARQIKSEFVRRFAKEKPR